MEESEFMKAYDAYADALFRHCYFRIYDRERAKDLVQDSFMKAWEYAAGGKKIDNLRAFLYKILHNLIVDEFRKKKTISLDELQEMGIEPKADLKEKIENFAEVKNLIFLFQKLEPAYREAATMRYVDDLTPREISEITGETENVISVRLNRAANKLRDMVKI